MVGSDGKESACNAGDLGLIPGLGRSLGEGNGYPLQYSFLEDPMDTGAWQAIVYRAAKRWTRLKQLGTCISMPYLPQVNLTTFPHSFQGPFNY